jgi:alpha/beta superfamily hydrolase
MHFRRVAIKTIRTTFPSGGLEIEGILYIPDAERQLPAVVVCHPHPQYGGNMDNNVVSSLCEALSAGSFIAFKFNFRGTGMSQGSFTNGPGEMDDVRAAVSFITSIKEADPGRIGVAGYSAGSAWGLSATCGDARVKALAAISPPLTMFDFNCLVDCTKPKLMISGDMDALIPATPFINFCQHLAEPVECHTIEGADHTWYGFEDEVARKVTDFFRKAL